MVKPLRALVIEDEEEIRGEIEHCLTAEGFVVETAANGMEGLKCLEISPVDLVITDILMPEKEGLETIMAIRKRSPQMHIVAISGGGPFPSSFPLDVAEKFGADAILAKPFRAAELLAIIGDVLGRSRPVGD